MVTACPSRRSSWPAARPAAPAPMTATERCWRFVEWTLAMLTVIAWTARLLRKPTQGAGLQAWRRPGDRGRKACTTRPCETSQDALTEGKVTYVSGQGPYMDDRRRGNPHSRGMPLKSGLDFSGRPAQLPQDTLKDSGEAERINSAERPRVRRTVSGNTAARCACDPAGPPAGPALAARQRWFARSGHRGRRRGSGLGGPGCHRGQESAGAEVGAPGAKFTARARRAHPACAVSPPGPGGEGGEREKEESSALLT